MDLNVLQKLIETIGLSFERKYDNATGKCRFVVLSNKTSACFYPNLERGINSVIEIEIKSCKHIIKKCQDEIDKNQKLLNLLESSISDDLDKDGCE